MEKITFNKVVGFILAMLFALVMGICMKAVVVGDYMGPNTVLNDQSQQTLNVLGIAGGLAALVAWWVQGFAAQRSFIVRFCFALFVFVLAFCAFGGLLRVIFAQIARPNLLEWSLTDYYWNPLSDLYTFVLFLLVPPRPAYGILMLAAALYLALFGPRQPRTLDV